ncbi:MAG: DUF898 family protein, partial [Pseudomonadota bacterium]
GYMLLTVLTLGWFGPAARLRLSKKLWNNAYYGGEPIKFEPTPEAKQEPVYQSFAVSFFGTLAAYGLWFWLLFSTVQGIPLANGEDPETALDLSFIIVLYASFIPLTLAVGLLNSWHEAVMIRRIVKSLRVDGASLSSRIRMLDILELTTTNLLLIVLTLGIGVMAAQMRLWKRIANRLDVNGEIDFNAIRQSDISAPKTGEGLADGLDLVSNF